MTTVEKLQADRKQALVDGDDTKRALLSVLWAESLLRAKDDEDRPVTDTDIAMSARSIIKKSRETIDTLKGKGKEAAVDKALDEVLVLMDYLPPELNENEIREAIYNELAIDDNRGRIMKAIKAYADSIGCGIDMKLASDVYTEIKLSDNS